MLILANSDDELSNKKIWSWVEEKLGPRSEDDFPAEDGSAEIEYQGVEIQVVMEGGEDKYVRKLRLDSASDSIDDLISMSEAWLDWASELEARDKYLEDGHLYIEFEIPQNYR